MATAKKKITLGLLGCGRMGKVYARHLARTISQARLAAVADIMAETAQQIAAELEVPRWHADPHALLQDKEIDAVVIATPTHTHKDMIISAAQSQKWSF